MKSTYLLSQVNQILVSYGSEKTITQNKLLEMGFYASIDCIDIIQFHSPSR